ncbi:MAG: dihydrofolate reductase [Geobacteraceae bacterium]|nr:dihydrofolate reductase [Geobacteraceae bacterium]
MRISLIAAMAENRVIGRNGAIPWDLPADRRRFRGLTWGHPVIMGRRTFESIGHPLAGRRNIVLTRQPGYRVEGCVVVHDLRSALEAAAEADEIFVIGGGELYREALPLAERIYLTIVHVTAAGDVLFPELPAGEFVEKERREVRDAISCDFVIYERRAL